MNLEARLRLLQIVCPSPRRLVQQLVLDQGLRTGLDIGCGETSLLSPLRAYGFRTTGIDASTEMLAKARQANLHDDYIVGDVAKHEFTQRFDVVVCSHMIEHLPRSAGITLLDRLDAVAGRIIYMETPRGFLEQTAVGGNPYQRHLSGWFPHDFAARGYSVFGMGLSGLRGPEGRARVFPEPVTRSIDRGLQWLLYQRPRAASTIAAVKLIDAEGNVRQLGARL